MLLRVVITIKILLEKMFSMTAMWMEVISIGEHQMAKLGLRLNLSWILVAL